RRPARSTTGVVFSPSGRAAVRYRAAAGVMLACGDPVGEKAAWPGAIERFMDEARALSRTPAVTGCSPAGAEVWARETGLDPWEGDGGGDGDGNDAAAGSPAGRVGRAGRGARGGSRRAGIRTEDPRLET
ncbi:phosphatidylglycerol lysyltransferase domain-containing protein, partial [Streptomyces zhihengii]|uniref:phosphatidylglycerol lysyltransferase domain-containing protein n=1 Tax=Streptomyces zhihengii TaxID=1818004 RepID=UPI003F4C2240